MLGLLFVDICQLPLDTTIDVSFAIKICISLLIIYPLVMISYYTLKLIQKKLNEMDRSNRRQNFEFNQQLLLNVDMRNHYNTSKIFWMLHQVIH